MGSLWGFKPQTDGEIIRGISPLISLRPPAKNKETGDKNHMVIECDIAA